MPAMVAPIAGCRKKKVARICVVTEIEHGCMRRLAVRQVDRRGAVTSGFSFWGGGGPDRRPFET